MKIEIFCSYSPKTNTVTCPNVGTVFDVSLLEMPFNSPTD